MKTEAIKKSLIGGEFLINDISSDSIFTIDDFDDDFDEENFGFSSFQNRSFPEFFSNIRNPILKWK